MPDQLAPLAGDGFVRRYSSGTWSATRSAGSGDDNGGTSTGDHACYADIANPMIYRGFFPFDLSGIPAGATILSATLKLYVTAKASGGGGTTANNSVCMVASTQASPSALANSDFSQVGSTEWMTRVPFANLTASAYNDFPLNATGIAALQAAIGSTIKLALRSGYDLDNAAPSGTSSMTVRFGEFTGTSSDPILEVTWVLAKTASESGSGSEGSSGAGIPVQTSGSDSGSASDAASALVSVGYPATAIAYTQGGSDAFTGSGLLSGHTPDTGPAWSKWYGPSSADLTLTGAGRVYCSHPSGAGTAIYRQGPTFADGYAQADEIILSDGGYILVSVRNSGTSPADMSEYQLYLDNRSGINPGRLTLAKVVAGSATVLGTYEAGTLSGTYTLRIEAIGTSIKGYLNGVERISATDSSITSAGYPTLSINTANGTSSSAGVNADNWSYGTTSAVSLGVESGTGTDAGSMTDNSTATKTASDSGAATDTSGGLLARIQTRAATGTRAASGSPTTVFAGGTVGAFGAHYAFPSGALLPDGSQLIACRKATSHGSYDGVLVLKQKPSGGAWGSEATIFDNRASSYDERDPSLTVLASGRLAMCWQRRTVSGGSDRFAPLVSFCAAGADPTVAANWSTPVQIATSGTVSNWTVASDIAELPNGDLLCATYGTPSLPWTIDRVDISKSTDGGATWTYLSALQDGSGHGSLGVAEPNLLVRANGDVLAIYRTVDPPWEIWAKVSTNGGATWGSEYRIATNSVNRAGICKTADGDVIVAYAYLNTTLYFEQSTDEGATFGTPVNLGLSVNVWADPYVTSTTPGTVNAAITYGNENGGQTQSSVYVQDLTAITGGVTLTDNATGTDTASVTVGVGAIAKTASDSVAGTDTAGGVAVTYRLSASDSGIATDSGGGSTAPPVAATYTLPLTANFVSARSQIAQFVSARSQTADFIASPTS